MFRWISIIALFILCSSAYAFKVEPMVAEMRPFGNKAQMSMRIDNTSDKPLTVELFSYSMTMDKYGEETRVAADDELLVIPATAIIKPGRSQSVMIRYLGDPAIAESKAYRVSIKQVQVLRQSEQSAQVGLLFQFNTLINVRPDNTFADLNVESIQQKGNKWIVPVVNSGKSYGRLTNARLNISDGVKSALLKGPQISKHINGTLVLPNSTRYFEMEPLANFNVETVSIDISQD